MPGSIRVWFFGGVLGFFFCAVVSAETVCVAVFDFATAGEIRGDAQVLKDKPYGAQLADSVRLKLRREGEGLDVLDRLTISEASPPLPGDADPVKVRSLLTDRLGAHVGLYGTVRKVGPRVEATITCLDLREGGKPLWTKTFVDDTQRARAVLAREIVQAVLGRELWRPPEYGDEPEPKRAELGRPINVNGDFERGAVGWERPDNVSTFLADSPDGHGRVLRVRTDLQRDPWLAYRRDLLLGRADPDHPPQIETDTSYGCVGGLEGVHVRSDFLPVEPGWRFWLLADVKGSSRGMFFPKVFVKGFARPSEVPDGLPESSLAEMHLTAEQFADLPADRRRQLIEADLKKNPLRYVREYYRWYLPCRCRPGVWNHFAAPVPPRGGLPKDVEYLQIQIYSYWPPGEYLWDNVQLFRDPRQKAPLPEEGPQMPGGENSSRKEAPR